MPKRNMKTSTKSQTEDVDNVDLETENAGEPELAPPERQRMHDGADHGVRLHSREEVIRRHGAPMIHANEEAADDQRQTRGHAARLRKNHGR